MGKKKLGEGSYGCVSKCTLKSTKAIRAVKLISKAQKNLDRFKKEIDIMKVMDHPNILRLHETFEDQRFIYLVVELCSGGELFERIINAGHFNEHQAAIIMKHLFRAIHYMHSCQFSHRDLKPENFLFLTKDDVEKSTLKVIDFGLACACAPGQVLKTKAGTPYYVAPQVLNGKYNELADVWSLGVIMFVLLCGYPPFYGDTDADVLAKVRVGSFTFSPKDWKQVSADAKELITCLLKFDPKERYTAEQALNHKWVVKEAPNALSVDFQDMFKNFNSFSKDNKLKRAARQMIPSILGETSQIKRLKDAFLAFDKNGDGRLTRDEMSKGLREAGFDDEAYIKSIVDQMDTDGSGEIEYNEFLTGCLDRNIAQNKAVFWQLFNSFDLNGDGKISRSELAQVVKEGENSPDVIEILQQTDTNGDGEIDFDEFIAAFETKSAQVMP